jgi:HK97 family phage major capsid protein
MTLLELKAKRLNLVTLGRAIHKKATDEKREMTAEEAASFNAHMDASDAVKVEIDALATVETRTKRLKDAEDELNRSDGRRTEPGDPGRGTETADAKVFKFPARSRKGLLAHMTTREIPLNPTQKKFAAMSTPEARALFVEWLATGNKQDELRGLQVDIDTAGGYLVTPQQFAAELIAIVDNLVFIRRHATVMTLTNATTLGVPSRDVDIADSDWTSELATGNEDTALAFGKRELSPHPLAKRIKVSNKLLRAGALDVESIVKDRLAYKFGVTQEKAFLLGNGTQQPLGVFIPTTNGSGISTARDVITGSTTNYTADGLINAKYALKPQYWPEARFMFHRTGIAKIRQLKDSNGQYLWAPSGIGQANLSEDNNDRILEFPFDVSEYCPNTFTTGLYVGILAAWSHYWIAEALTMQLQRLVELYAEKNQTGYIARAELDGAPVLEEPFVRLITN